MEALKILLRPEDFDRLVRAGAQEVGDMAVAMKSGATVEGRAAVVVAFTVALGDELVKVQAVTTLRLLGQAVDAFRTIDSQRSRGG